MAVVNHVLWLKARLAGRLRGSRTAHVLSVAGTLSGLGLSLAFAAVLALYVAEAGPITGRPILATGLLAMYASWVFAPALGYRVSEGLDPALLAHFPVSRAELSLAVLFANFLDPVVLVSSPVLVAGVVCGWVLGGDPLAAGVGAGLFLFHAMATSQLFYLLMLGSIRRRSARDLAMIALPLLIFAVSIFVQLEAWSFERAGDDLVLQAAKSLGWVEHLATWLPPGLLMEAILPVSEGTVFRPWEAVGLLAAIAVLTVVVATRVSFRSLDETGMEVPPVPGKAGAGEDHLYRFFLRLVPSRPVAARAAVECRLMCREPQYVLMALMYLVLLAASLSWATTRPDRSEAARALSPLLLYSGIFVFAGPVLNSFAVERGALRFACSSPVDALRYVLGKNLGAWLPITCLHAIAALVVAWVAETWLLGFLTSLVAGQVALWSLIGVGNIASCLAPQPLPAQGSVSAKATTMSQLALTMTVGTLGIGLSMTIALVGVGIALLPLAWGPAWRAGPGFPALGLAWVAGAYTMSTLAASYLFGRRQEEILEILG